MPGPVSSRSLSATTDSELSTKDAGFAVAAIGAGGPSASGAKHCSGRGKEDAPAGTHQTGQQAQRRRDKEHPAPSKRVGSPARCSGGSD